MTAEAPLGEFSDYETLHEALRSVREMRDITFDDLDSSVGAPKGYFSKVLSLGGQRALTMGGFVWLLSGLGLKAIIVNDPKTLAKTNQQRARDKRLVRVAHKLNVVTSKRWAEIRKKGPPARMAKLSPEQRSEIGRQLAKARWGGR